MANAQEIRRQLGRLISHELSLDDFDAWFAPYSWNIHKNGDAEAQTIAYAVEHQLSVFDDDCPELWAALTRIHGSATGQNLESGESASFLVAAKMSVAGAYGNREESQVELTLAV